MHIVYLSKIPVYPVNGGEQLRGHGLIQILSENANRLSVIIPFSNKLREEIPANVNIYDYKFNKKHQVFPFYREKGLIKLVSEIHENNIIDLVYIDYFFFGQYIQYFKKKGIKVIYGTHNAQANLIRQRKYDDLVMRILNHVYYHIVRLHEKYYFNKADRLVVVSSEDQAYHGNFVDVKKIFIIPNFLDSCKYDQFLNAEKQKDLISFCANFKSFQNIEGFKWFLNYIWKKPINTKYRLLLIGRGSKELLNGFKSNNMFNIEATGEVDSISPYLSVSKLSIVPLLHGSGSRLKCLESMALKTQLVSTKKGIEGINHEGKVLVADSETDFINHIESVMTNDVDMTDDAYDIFKRSYSKDACSLIIKEIIYDVCENNGN